MKFSVWCLLFKVKDFYLKLHDTANFPYALNKIIFCIVMTLELIFLCAKFIPIIQARIFFLFELPSKEMKKPVSQFFLSKRVDMWDLRIWRNVKFLRNLLRSFDGKNWNLFSKIHGKVTDLFPQLKSAIYL